MGKTKVIRPVTRLEGHAKITIHLDEDEKVKDAKLHVTEYRGYEAFVRGRPFWEMPDITSRICGICPVSHHLGAAKAGDVLVNAKIPKAAKKLRELLHMGQIVQSHALSFFYLSVPDLALGYGAKPEKRNIVGLLNENPDLARRGITLHKFGQTVIELLGKKRVHPEFAIPGGVNGTMDEKGGKKLLRELQPLKEQTRATIETLREIYVNIDREILNCDAQKTGYMGLVGKNDELEHYDGELKLIDEKGNVLERFDPAEYSAVISERSKEWSYLKFPYYKKRTFEEGIYRVGPLARLNIAERVETEQAREEFERFKGLANGIEHRAIYYHYARLIEILFGLERIQELLEDEEVYNGPINVPARPQKSEGVGVIEAPRGTLIHHYKIDANGKVKDANFIIATNHNNAGMNESIKNVAKKFVEGPEIPEGTLNKIESALRCYDPCLSCATHAIGRMPIDLKLISADNEILDEVRNETIITVHSAD